MNRTTWVVCLVMGGLLASTMCFAQSPPYRTLNYGNWDTSQPNKNFDELFDLTYAPLRLSYTIDMSDGAQVNTWDTIYTTVGIRQEGAANFNPGTFGSHPGGAGGWMTSFWGDLATDPNNLDLDDKHNLNSSGGVGETAYDALGPKTIVSSFGTQNSYGFWFDRDGVDPWQDDAIANTGGVYDITIMFTAVDASTGTMFATINGVQQGFDTTVGDGFNIDTMPAGLSFTGDMTKMQVFAGSCGTTGASGTVEVSDIRAQETPEPATIFLLMGSAAVVGVMRRRERGSHTD